MDSRIERAWVLIDLGRLEPAREMLAEMLAGEPEDGQALAAMAELMYRLEEFERSLGYSAAGLRVWPDSSFLWRSRALAYWQLGRTESIDPEVHRKRNAAALAAAQRAVELDPDNIDNLRILAVAQRRIDPDAALEALDLALRINAEIPDIHFVRALVLRQLRSRDDAFGEQAEAAFHEVLRLDPDNAAAAFELGMIENGRGQLEQARERFRMSARLDPRFADDARTHIERIERQLSRVRKAAATDSENREAAAQSSLAPATEPAATESLPAVPARSDPATTRIDSDPTPEPDPAAECQPALEIEEDAARVRVDPREALRHNISKDSISPEKEAATSSRRWGRSMLLIVPILLFVRLVASGCSADSGGHQPPRVTNHPAPLYDPANRPIIESAVKAPPVVLVPHG